MTPDFKALHADLRKHRDAANAEYEYRVSTRVANLDYVQFLRGNADALLAALELAQQVEAMRQQIELGYLCSFDELTRIVNEAPAGSDLGHVVKDLLCAHYELDEKQAENSSLKREIASAKYEIEFLKQSFNGVRQALEAENASLKAQLAEADL